MAPKCGSGRVGRAGRRGGGRRREPATAVADRRAGCGRGAGRAGRRGPGGGRSGAVGGSRVPTGAGRARPGAAGPRLRRVAGTGCSRWPRGSRAPAAPAEVLTLVGDGTGDLSAQVAGARPGRWTRRSRPARRRSTSSATRRAAWSPGCGWPATAAPRPRPAGCHARRRRCTAPARPAAGRRGRPGRLPAGAAGSWPRQRRAGGAGPGPGRAALPWLSIWTDGRRDGARRRTRRGWTAR